MNREGDLGNYEDYQYWQAMMGGMAKICCAGCCWPMACTERQMVHLCTTRTCYVRRTSFPTFNPLVRAPMCRK